MKCPKCGSDCALDPMGGYWCQNDSCEYVTPPTENYVPTAEDIKWARMMIAMIANGGVLGYPATKAIYSVNHPDKRLTLRNPDEILTGPDAYIHYRTKAVFAKIGYECIP